MPTPTQTLTRRKEQQTYLKKQGTPNPQQSSFGYGTINLGTTKLARLNSNTGTGTQELISTGSVATERNYKLLQSQILAARFTAHQRLSGK